MDKSLSLVYFPERSDYRKIAQENWGLTDLQMKNMHVHHQPPRSKGGRNIPEHLYVCSPDVHQYIWHKGSAFPKLASEGGNLSAIVRRKKAEERKKLPKEEQKRQKEERRQKRRERKRREQIREKTRLQELAKSALQLSRNQKMTGLMNEVEYQNLVWALVEEGLLLMD